MFFRIIFFFAFLFVFCSSTVFGSKIYVEDKVEQGGTLEIKIPSYQIIAVDGIFQGQKINFYLNENSINQGRKKNRGAF